MPAVDSNPPFSASNSLDLEPQQRRLLREFLLLVQFGVHFSASLADEFYDSLFHTWVEANAFSVRSNAIDHTANSDLDPAKLTRQSRKRAHWICSNGHSFESTIKARAYLESDCNYCINRKVMPGFNDLQTLHPEIAIQFDVERNIISADKVLAGTAESFYWLCPEGHSWKAKVSNRVSTNQSGCPGCSSTGFDSSKPGVLYVIQSTSLKAIKVGITNPDSKNDRIKGWIAAGWEVLFTHAADGNVIQSLELQIKRWIKHDLGLSQYLSKQDLKAMNGASETFSSEGVSAMTVIEKAKKLIADLDAKAHKNN